MAQINLQLATQKVEKEGYRQGGVHPTISKLGKNNLT